MFQKYRPVLAVGLLAVVIAVVPGALRADEPVMTNLDVVKKLTTDVIEEMLTSVPEGVKADEVWVASPGNDERYNFVFDMLTGTLTARGVKTHDRLGQAASDSSGANSGVVVRGNELWLEFDIHDFDLEYTKIYRKFLIGGKKVKRRADVSLIAKLVDSSDGLVLWQGEASKSYSDQFPYSQISEVEAGLHEFTKPPREGRSWGKVIEPIAVSAIIVGLIYLFFSNQSGD
ncbi:MAG: hypothetical protein JSW50_04830 [Candidatus Latescibacterota bacterium]|nr:MAG: hypothetical protein JSW50_04830 [Candidatus Latescibacterota bacterium]